MMEHILKLLKRHGFSDIACTLWYLPQDVTEYFQDGSAWGLHLGYYIEQEPLGTAGSVKNAAQMLQSTFVVMSGDALTDIDLTSAVAFHREKGALATLVLTQVENPLNYGVVLTGESGRNHPVSGKTHLEPGVQRYSEHWHLYSGAGGA